MQTLSLILLSSIFLLPMVQLVIPTSAVYAADSKKFIEKPKGLIENNEKAGSAISMLNWLLSGISVIASVLFLISGASRINSGHYTQGLGSITGAVLAGIAAYLVSSFIA